MHTEVKTSGVAGIATMKMHSEGSQGAVSTIISTKPETTAQARLDVRADPGASTTTSGDAHVHVYSRSQDAIWNTQTDGKDVLVTHKTTFTDGAAHMKVLSEGTKGATMTLASTNAATTSVSKLHIYADGSAAMSLSSRLLGLRVWPRPRSGLRVLQELCSLCVPPTLLPPAMLGWMCCPILEPPPHHLAMHICMCTAGAKMCTLR